MKKLPLLLLLLFAQACFAQANYVDGGVTVGAERMDKYLPMLKGRRVGIVTNSTGLVGRTHLVDTLLSCGTNIALVWAPEHGFRGNLGAGEHVGDETDAKTGIRIASLHGNSKKPKMEDLKQCDIIVFDIQDVGLRYYTYLSTLHYVMETCAGNGVPLVVLDRPNPNGMYIDGPILDTVRYRSFVGMHPIPIVHGMTLGELARMINGEKWLKGGVKCDLVVVGCENYTHATRYKLPVRPSPNLPNMRAIYLYPSLCFFEATPVSIGRGTDFPFQVYGNPGLAGDFTFTPLPNAGAPTPPQSGKLCRGRDMRTEPDNETIIARGVDLTYLIDCYRQIGNTKFLTPFFENLMGVPYVREMIEHGRTAGEIKARWAGDVEKFRIRRQPYLLYEEN